MKLGKGKALKDSYTLITEEAILRLGCFERCRETACNPLISDAKRREARRNAASIASELDGLYFALDAISHAGFDAEIKRIHLFGSRS